MGRRANKRNAIIVAPSSFVISESDQDGESSREQDRRAADLQAAQEILTKNQRRRDAKRKAIETDHKQRVEKIRVQIDAFYEVRKQKVSKLQITQWDRLDSLLRKRQSIEGQIVNHLKNLEQISLNLTSELDAVYAGRLEDIAELDTTGKI